MESFNNSEKNNNTADENRKTGQTYDVGKIAKRGMAEIDIKEFISAFAVLIAACIIPYVVRIADIFILVLIGIGSQDKRGSYTFGELLTQDFNQPMNLAYVMAVNYLLYIIIFGLWYRHCHKVNSQYETDNEEPSGLRPLLNRLLKLFKTPVPYLLIIAGCSGQILVDSILNIFRNIFPDAFEEYDALVSGTVGPTSSIVMLIAVFILAPIGEEFLFRGLIQGKLAKAVNGSPMPIVILLQALLFAIYHGNLIQGIYAFFLGAVLGLIAYRADSLLPGMVFHMALNSSVCLVSETWFEETATCIIAGIISLVVFAPSVIAALRILKKTQV
jgi:membrane protease YdiL (CAAX protease family)